MQKEELLHLHMLFIHVKKYYETITHEEIETSRYNDLKISPVHIHKNKRSHKEALLVLSEEITDHIRQNRLPVMSFSPKTLIGDVEISIEN
ncbi:MAG: UPF0058 family protein [Methanospirillaceae archaeon]|nr:UPF0058 family protein [Methanospirillaceae archaeon]